MKNLKQLSAITLCTLFATMQVTFANIDTGLGAGNGGASIINGGAGYQGITGQGTNNVGLNFNANSHVKWDTLNVNSGETLNFNAVNGAKNLTILNTVQNNMSKIYGNINANSGISQLIISNPNGMLYDGAKFTTAGDVMLTTKDMTNVNVNNLTDGAYTKFTSADWVKAGSNDTQDLIQVQIKDSDFTVGGDFNIYAPKVVGTNSTINANTLKLTTANGADYLAQGLSLKENKGVTLLTAMDINGDIVITNDVGALSIAGSDIDGDVKANVGGLSYIDGIYNKTTGALEKKTTITGDADFTAHGQQLIARDVEVDGNINMYNDGGAVELRNATVGGDANLKTEGWQPINHEKYNHYVHVSGNTDITGDLNIESSQNIHIGNYEVTNNPYSSTSTTNHWEGNLLPGKLTVGGDIKAKVTDGGHIMTTIDTTAKNIDYTAKSRIDGTKTYGGNILSDNKSVIKANTYKFKSDGYIGGMKTANGQTIDNKIIDTMEEYVFIPADIPTDHDYMNINGGTITKLETPKVSAGGNDVQVYIKSNNDLLVNGANAGIVNIVAPDKKITITGNNVHAKEINVGGRTGTLQLDFPKRDFTTNYTNIKDGVVKTIKPTDVITYDLTNNPSTGYNSPDLKPTNGTNTTYLVGPGFNPVPPGPEPEPTPGPKPGPKPTDDDNVRVKNWVPEDPMKPLVNTPVAFAADLDDDQIEGPCRKNVDGSVTVVRAYPVNN